MVLDEENQDKSANRQKQIATSCHLQSVRKRINNQISPPFNKRQKPSEQFIPITPTLRDLLDVYDRVTSVHLPKNWAALLLDDKVVIGCWSPGRPLPTRQLFILNDFSIKVCILSYEILKKLLKIHVADE